jgi:hypothetical protein
VPAIPDTGTTTVAAIYAAIASASREERRAHLGASILGRECRRALWLAFRWSDEPLTDGRIFRLFRRGQLEEAQFVRDLRAAGVTVHDVDERGQQFRFADVGGHVGGSMDAAVLGLVEAPKTYHVAEFKTAGAKPFADLVKHGVEKSKPEHWAQMQLYMHWTGMERAYYLAVCKDTDELHGERVKYDKAAAEALIAKARAIVTAPEPLERISEKPEFFTCKFCSARPVCHEKRIPAPSCRTCVHATPELDGDARWSCAFRRCDLTLAEQRVGCPDHVYIPQLVPLEFVEGDEAGNFAEYKRPGGEVLRNGSGDKAVYTSAELYAAQDDLTRLDDATLNWLRMNMGGRLESVRPDPPKEFDDWEQVKTALPLKSERVDIYESEIPF